DEVGGDGPAALLLDDREGGFDDPGGVDLPGVQGGGHLVEGQFHELHAVGVAAGLAHGFPHGGVAYVLQRVDRDLLPGQVLRRLDRAVALDDDTAEVGAGLPGGGDTVGDGPHGHVAAPGDHQRGRVAEPEGELAADHARHDRCAALAGLQREVEAALAVEPLLLAEVDGSHVDDGDHADLHGGEAVRGRVGGPGRGGTTGRRGEREQ